MLEEIFKHNLELVGILSNGSGFSAEVLKLIEENKERVAFQIDLHSIYPEYYEWFTGNRYAYEKAVDTISKVTDTGVPVRIACNVTPKNVDHMFEIAETAHKLGATSIAFGPIAPLGRAKVNKNLILSMDSFKKFVSNMNKLINVYGKDFITTLESRPNAINCGAGWNSLTISPNFDVKICQMASVYIENLRRYGYSYRNFLIENSDLLQTISETPAPNDKICKNCNDLWFCHGCITRGMQKASEKGERCLWRKEILEPKPLLLEKLIKR
ncbi:hypothetical protein ACMTAS_1352 [Thermotoga neapolitana DSM 4359]|uniref:Fe-S oxidoreductase-like protein n=1 Tax=Thermotoga neapolitana (strain ATCC 49049 / DSM 4359 / NBRC 107923 / NS-E) TaxID=309803 RepID=B9K908_THENN|nr:Fe-S oxidoreductase-like protein [Thermotoga neapolitana DSM 4359]KFZ21469.1 Fe-S oxidoreductase-like protein [Thermotoga neapolitana LA10]